MNTLNFFYISAVIFMRVHNKKNNLFIYIKPIS